MDWSHSHRFLSPPLTPRFVRYTRREKVCVFSTEGEGECVDPRSPSTMCCGPRMISGGNRFRALIRKI
jgi:hypothetical protein